MVLQRYEVTEKLGEGPLFTVYKAHDRAANRALVLKSLAPPFVADRDFRQGLQSGLAAAGSLNHPNIAHFYEIGTEGEAGTDDEKVFAISEFVRGTDLKERIRRISPFTLSIAVDFLCEIAEALHYAHGHNQPHGDLCPQNVIISQEGVVKVTDFGVAQAIARSPEAQAATLARSAFYHAPELSLRQPGSVGGDVYALGAILYEMLTGTLPYTGGSPEAIADAHAFASIPSPRAVNPGVPRSVEGIVMKCLLKKPSQRYSSAGELLQDLKSVRDALRFGKPLSWSPVDIERLAADSSAEAAQEATARRAEQAAARAAVPAGVAAGLAGATGVAAAGMAAGAATSTMAGGSAATSATSGALPQNGGSPSRRGRNSGPNAADLPILPNAGALEPVAEVAASSRAQALPQPAERRMREQDDRVSIYIRVGILLFSLIIIGCLGGMVWIYSQKWVTPPQETVPTLVGKPIDEVRKIAEQLKITLNEHGQYTERPRDIVYKTSLDHGQKVRPGQTVNVFYSKGSIYVNVPNLEGVAKEDAEQKLKDAGLSLGRVTTEYNNTVPINAVVRQNVSYKKRVLHDTSVDVVVSDGPKPDYGDSNSNDSNTPPDANSGNDSGASGDNGDNSANASGNDIAPGPGDSGAASAARNVPDASGNLPGMHTLDRALRVPRDGKGRRVVRVEVTDSGGFPITVVDGETRDEGERVPLHFDYQGKTVTIKVYYNDKLSSTFHFDPEATKGKNIQ